MVEGEGILKYIVKIMLTPLTKKQKEVFRAFYDLFTKKRNPPTTREVGDYLGRKSCAAELEVLIKKGWLERIDGQAKRNRQPTSAGEMKIKEEINQLRLF